MGARCDLCPLFKEGVVVPPSPAAAGKVRLVVIGDGPGRIDEKCRAPLSGAGGTLLFAALHKGGIKRGQCHVTNVALCRGESDKENERAAECCSPRLLAEVSGLPAGVPILTLGKAPLIAVLGVRSLLQARGFIWTAKEIDKKHVSITIKAAYKRKEGPKRDSAVLRGEILAARAGLRGRVVLPALHPSFILRADTWHPVFTLDIARAARLVGGGVCTPLEDVSPYHVGGPEVLRGLGATVSLDTETDGIDTRRCKMLCVGLSDTKKTVVIWPWKKAYAPRLAAFLRSRKGVVCHNGIFDIPVLRSHGVE